MKNIKYILAMMTCTSIFWYLVVSFIYWDIVWVNMIPSFGNLTRLGMFGGIIIKLYLDVGIWVFFLKDELINQNKDE